MKKLIAPAFSAVLLFFVAQVAFKIPSLIRCGSTLLPGEFLRMPFSSILAIAVADTLGIASVIGAGLSFATFMFGFVSHAEAAQKKANKS